MGDYNGDYGQQSDYGHGYGESDYGKGYDAPQEDTPEPETKSS